METIVPQAIIDFIESREDFRTHVYRDTKGILTAGMGHKLLPVEIKRYPLGAQVPSDILEAWAEADGVKAYNAALGQSTELGVTAPEFIKVLTSVCFQLGTHWPLEFAQTWGMLLDHDWQRAAKNLDHSLWKKQSATRVEDFQAALLAIAAPTSEASVT